MDKEFLKRLVDNDYSKYIEEGDYLDVDFTQYLKCVSPSKITKLFKPNSPKDAKYDIEMKCDDCKQIIKTKANREIIKLIFQSLQRHKFYCTDCKSKHKIAQCVNIESENTFHDEFINHALKPYGSTTIKNIMGEHGFEKEIRDIITRMDYDDFLETAYWDSVRRYKLHMAGYKCQMCGCSGTLNVHHSTYRRHGSEHLFPVANHDLIVLCEDCHDGFHKIQSDTPLLPNGMTQEEWDEI